jgi:hypothetical protein
MDTKIFLIFTNVVFLGVSYMTYCRETRDTKNAVRERVLKTNSVKNNHQMGRNAFVTVEKARDLKVAGQNLG